MTKRKSDSKNEAPSDLVPTKKNVKSQNTGGAKSKCDKAGAMSEIEMLTKAVCVRGKPMFWSSENGSGVLRSYREAKIYFSQIGWFDDKGNWRDAFPVWQRSLVRKNWAGLEFRPLPPGCADTVNANQINSWTGWSVEPKPGGTYKKLEELIRDGMCAGSDELFKWYRAWLAHSVQKPAKLPGTAIVMYGQQGIGKNTIFNAASSLCKNHSFEVTTQDQLTGRFTSHLCNRLYVLSDEATYAKSKQALGRLKALITSSELAVDEKNKPIYAVQNYTRLFICTNNDSAYPSEIGERRSAVFKFADVFKGDKVFFRELYAELAKGGSEALLYDLLRVDLAALPDPTVIPETEGLIEQKINWLDSATSFALDVLEAGELIRNPQFEYGNVWPDFVVVSDLWENYLRYAKEGNHRYQESSPRGLLKKLTSLLGLWPQSKSRKMSRSSSGGTEKPKTRKVPTLEDSAAIFRKATGLPVDLEANDHRKPVIIKNNEVPENVVPLTPRQTPGMTGAHHG